MARASPGSRQIAELARAVAGALDLDAVLKEVTAAVVALRGNCACVIRLTDRAAGGYRLAASGGVAVYSLPAILPFGQGLAHVVAMTRQPLLVEDAPADPRTPVHAHEGLRRMPVFYGTPIEAGEEVLGILVLLAPAGAPPSEDEQHALSLLAGLAAVAIRNSRVLAESEARRRAAEALAEVGRGLAQAHDVAMVARRIVDGVHAVLGIQTAALFRLDADTGELISLATSGDVEAAMGRDVIMPPGTGISGLAVRERRLVVSANLLADPRIAMSPGFRARLEAASFRAGLGVPLMVQDRVVGALVVADRPGRVFAEEEIRLTQSFADQAALALERARLYDQARRRRREAEVIADVARELSASLELDHVLQRVVDAARELTGSDLAHIALADATMNAMVFRYWTGVRYEGRQAFQVVAGKGVGGQVLASGRPFRTDDYARDPRVSPDYVASVQAEGIVASMAVPIIIEGRLDGLLFVDNRARRPFTDRDEAILVRLAAHAGIAIRNARLRQREQAARAEAEAANRAKDEFLAMLGHELRNPLSAIRSAASVLRRGSGDGELVARLQALIERQTQHLGRLVDDLLDISRLHSGKIAIERSPVNLKEVAERALATFVQSSRTVAHDVRLDGSSVTVSGDAMRLEQVIANLLDNALKYTPPGGRVRITVGPEGDDAVLRIADTGAGVPADKLSSIFALFVQAGTVPGRAPSGLGLGLTLVRRLVELHGGAVVASSAGPGQGSEFTVHLPRLPGDAPADEAPVAAPAVAARTVLVIEDNADVRESMRVLLEIAGHRVIEAADGPAGLVQAAAGTPDVALIDIGLPGIDGYAVARELRALPRAAPIFLVALTGYGQAADRRRALEAGFHAHLVKPVDPAELTRLLAQPTPTR